MSITNTATAHKLCKNIQTIRHKKFGWSDELFHYILVELGFGKSLRALDENKLNDLKFLLVEIHPTGQPEAFVLDRQGCDMMSLARKAGWAESDLRRLYVKQFRKTHWNVLSKSEKQELITLFFKSFKHTFNLIPEEICPKL